MSTDQTNTRGPRRSLPGTGDDCLIYVLGSASEHADTIVPRIGDSAICGPNRGEDFAHTIWPVVIKVKPGVSDFDLVTHLRDLADVIEQASWK